MNDLILREPEASDETAFRNAVREFATTDPDWEFAFDFDEQTNFADYVSGLRRARLGHDLPAGRVPSTFFVAVVGEEIVGRVSLRHELNDFLLEFGGHCGFGVVPSARRRGYGTEILRQSLAPAKAVGIERLLVTCDEHNVGSIRIIETCGGVLEDTRPRDGGGRTRRYWIDLSR